MPPLGERRGIDLVLGATLDIRYRLRLGVWPIVVPGAIDLCRVDRAKIALDPIDRVVIRFDARVDLVGCERRPVRPKLLKDGLARLGVDSFPVVRVANVAIDDRLLQEGVKVGHRRSGRPPLAVE